MEGSARRTCNGRERGRGQGYDEPVNRLSSEESERFRPMTERGDAGPDEVGDVRSFDDFVFEKRLRAGFGGESSAGDREPPVRAVASASAAAGSAALFAIGVQTGDLGERRAPTRRVSASFVGTSFQPSWVHSSTSS